MGLLETVIYNLINMKKAKRFRSMSRSELLAMDSEDFFDAVECICEDAVYEISDPELTVEQRYVYCLIKFEMEVNNGGLCQFFVNSSRECAPYISDALHVIGADRIKALYDSFITENGIDVNDLSSFEINKIEEYEDQTQRFDFDRFDDEFCEDEKLHQQIIDYARKHLEQIV